MNTMGPGVRNYYDAQSTYPLTAGHGAYSGVGVTYSGVGAGYRVTDEAGYTFEVMNDASIYVRGAPRNDQDAIGMVYEVGTPAYETLVARLKTADPDIERALGNASTGGTQANVQRAGAFAHFIESMGLNTPEGQQNAAAFIAGLAPAIGQTVQSLLGSKGQDLPTLQGRLARIRVRLVTTTNPTKRAELMAEAQGIQAQIEALRTQQEEVRRALAGDGRLHRPTIGGIPFWVLPLTALVLGGAGVAYVLHIRARKGT